MAQVKRKQSKSFCKQKFLPKQKPNYLKLQQKFLSTGIFLAQLVQYKIKMWF